ncbi:MAG TPA: cytochrome c oxidase assembly protein [Caldimonas sp.]|nr:cytochrome c oxidase assembly protein [Caldimonas sp.]
MQLRRTQARAFAVALVSGVGALPVGAAAHALDAGGAAPPIAWTFEPWVVICLAVSAGLYATGLVRLWRHAGAGRGIRAGRVVAFAGGWLTLVAALVSPLDALGSYLFSAHMVQHELLMVAAAPLLVLGHPLAAWAWAFPPALRRALGRFFHRPGWRGPWLALTGPLAGWLLHAVALWGWHLPSLFDAALRSEAVHAVQHIAFLGTALVFWWTVLGAGTRREQGIALVSLFTTMVHTGALGALLTLAPVAFYEPYAATAPAFGYTPLEDQQLGGLVMWVPAGFVYVLVGLVLAARWIGGPRARSLAHPEPRASANAAGAAGVAPAPR